MQRGRRKATPHRDEAANGGFTLLAVLAWIGLASIGLSIVGPLWSQQSQRERERELVRVGEQFVLAIEAYRAASPGSEKQFPPSLEALTVDNRFAGTVRHLRRVYADPVNPSQPMGLIRNPTGRIVGVYSQSRAQPLAQAGMTWRLGRLPPASQYSDWKFLAPSAK
jgi:type II secretory pathway pseudopilin PulG